MLDTILNLGLNDATVEALARATGNERFAWDSYRRFAQMFGNVAKGVPGEQIEDLIAERKREAGVKLDTELERGRPAAAHRRPQGASTTSPRIRWSSSTPRCGRCSTPGRATGPWPTAG